MSMLGAVFIPLLLLLSQGGADGEPARKEATIAFHISVNAAQLPLLDRFFSRIYHPNNLYLLDFAYPLPLRQYSTSPNVHHRIADPHVEHGVSEVINILDGMAYFLDREEALGDTKSFDYYIHCTPEDYPAVTQPHMRQILGFAASQPAPPNFFHFAHKSQLPLFQEEVNKVYYDFSLTFNRSLSLENGLETHNLYHPDHGRRTFSLLRTEKHFVVSHDYVQLATDSMYSKRLLMSVGDASHVFENFFGSLAHNAGDSVGKLIRTTSMRCYDSDALDKVVTDGLPDYKPRPPSVEFLHSTSKPCLFAGPFRASDPSGLSVRDIIDNELLTNAGSQGSPEGVGYHSKVLDRLKQVLVGKGFD